MNNQKQEKDNSIFQPYSNFEGKTPNENNLFWNAIQALNVGIAIISKSGQFIKVNKSICRFLGYPEQELTEKTVADIIFSEGENSTKIIKNGILNIVDFDKEDKRVIHKNGSLLWAHLTINLIEPDNYFEYATFSIEGINQECQLLFENMNEAFCYNKVITDENNKPVDFVIIDLNHIYEKVTGLKKEDIINKKASELFPTITKDRIERFGNVAITGKSIYYTFYSNDLSKHFETRVYSPRKGYFATIFSDISLKDNSESELKLHNERLERLVRLSKLNVTSYRNLIFETMQEVAQMTCSTVIFGYYWDTMGEDYRMDSWIAEKNVKITGKQKKWISGYFNEITRNKKSCLLHGSEITILNSSFKKAHLESLVFVPIIFRNRTIIILALGRYDQLYNDVDIKHVTLFAESAWQLIEKQMYHEQVVAEKTKAEISESRFYEIQKAGKIGWYEVLLDQGLYLGSYETYNIFFDEYYDYAVTPEQLVNVIHPDDKDLFFETVQRNVEKKSPEFDWEYRLVTPGKGLKYIYSKAFLKFDNEGKLVRRYGIVQDITEKKINEIKIKKHSDQLESLFRISHLKTTSSQSLLDHALSESLSLTNSEFGFIIYKYNDWSHTLYKWSPGYLIKNKLKSPSIQTNLENDIIWHDILLENEPFINNELKEVFLKAEGLPGKKFKIRKFMSVPVIADRKLVLVIGIANKTDDYNEIDVKQLALLMDSVWKIVERQNYQEELIEAKERAEESDRLKTAFLANMSHEIRTPMNGIIGFSELFIQNDLSEDKRESYAKIVIESGKQLLSIVDDILDISKIEVGQINITKEKVYINTIINELFTFYSPRANEYNITLFPYKDLPDEKAVIETDKQRLIQVLSNLLNNAFKFTFEGEISFGYNFKNGFLEFYVKDTGSGIPKHMHEAIFERFIQVKTRTKSKFRGTGLGLSISQKLVHLLGGEIWLKSIENKGSTFYFTLPYKPVEPEEIIEIPGNVEEKIPLAKPLILVVEDEEINYKYLKEVLLKNGAFVIRANNGIEAIELTKKHPDIAIILMDIKMPEMDGLTATREIRKFQTTVPIIAQTAFAMEEDKQSVFLAGCNDFLPKPLNRNTILEVINKYL